MVAPRFVSTLLAGFALIAVGAQACGCLLLADYGFGDYVAAECTVTAFVAQGSSIDEWVLDGEPMTEIGSSVATGCSDTMSVRFIADINTGVATFDFTELLRLDDEMLFVLVARDASDSAFVCTANPSDQVIKGVTLVNSLGAQVDLQVLDFTWRPAAGACWLGLPTGPYSSVMAVTSTGKNIQIELL